MPQNTTTSNKITEVTPTVEADNGSEELIKNFKLLKDAVFAKKPILAEIVSKVGTKNLYSYALEYMDVNLNPPIQKRQDQFLSTFKKYTTSIVGEKIAAEATAQLAKYYYVSTADHLGPICHPFFINSNLIAAAPYNETPDPVLKYFIVLACTSISFDNSSFPRGLMFHSATGDGKIQQIGFFPRNARPCPVFNYRSYTKSDIERAKKQLEKTVKEGNVLPKEAEVINKLIDDVYLQEDVLNCKKFSDQVTKTNYKLWKRFFRNDKGTPDLLYLNQENLVSQLILDHHLTTDTAITRIIFDPTYHRSIMANFEGIMGAFSKKNSYGTYLFWALPKGSKYRLQLWRKENELVSEDGSYRLPLTTEAVRTALENKEIFPSTMLDFMVLAFYYGLKCLGGSSQINYLTFMKNAYLKTMVEQSAYKSIEVAARVQTKELCGDVTIAFLKNKKGELVPATGIDLVIHGTEKTWPQLVNLSKDITLEEALNPMMPDLYRETHTEDKRDPVLNSITANQITNVTNIGKKIKPCIEL